MTCPRCDGSGLLPFYRPDGSLSAFKEFCTCHPDLNEEEHYREVRPDDIDYPISHDYYRAMCRLHGWGEPPDDSMPDRVEPQRQEVIHRHSDMSKQEFNLLESHERSLKYILKKLEPKLQKKGRFVKYNDA